MHTCLCVCLCICLFLLSDDKLERLQRNALRQYAGPGPEAAANDRTIDRDVAAAAVYTAAATGQGMVLRRRRRGEASAETRACPEGVRIAEYADALCPFGATPADVAPGSVSAVGSQTPSAAAAPPESASQAAPPPPHSLVDSTQPPSAAAAHAPPPSDSFAGPRRRQPSGSRGRRATPYGWGVDGGAPSPSVLQPAQRLDFDTVMGGADAANHVDPALHAGAALLAAEPAAASGTTGADAAYTVAGGTDRNAAAAGTSRGAAAAGGGTSRGAAAAAGGTDRNAAAAAAAGGTSRGAAAAAAAAAAAGGGTRRGAAAAAGGTAAALQLMATCDYASVDRASLAATLDFSSRRHDVGRRENGEDSITADVDVMMTTPRAVDTHNEGRRHDDDDDSRW
eukprot:GHVU01121939.1.p1 GENE.GHVU01121939.1~~GHVU01121939.1.p1  ORF type:complete len:396 (-),score=71.28 GHVU01121939.1:768-1955(-)